MHWSCKRVFNHKQLSQIHWIPSFIQETLDDLLIPYSSAFWLLMNDSKMLIFSIKSQPNFLKFIIYCYNFWLTRVLYSVNQNHSPAKIWKYSFHSAQINSVQPSLPFSKSVWFLELFHKWSDYSACSGNPSWFVGISKYRTQNWIKNSNMFIRWSHGTMW